MSALAQVPARQFIRLQGAVWVASLVIFLLVGVDPAAAALGSLTGLAVALLATLSARALIGKGRLPGGPHAATPAWRSRQDAFERWFARGAHGHGGRPDLPPGYGHAHPERPPPQPHRASPALVPTGCVTVAGALAAALALVWLARRRTSMPTAAVR